MCGRMWRGYGSVFVVGLQESVGVHGERVRDCASRGEPVEVHA